MALHRVVITDEEGNFVGLEFVTSKAAADRTVKSQQSHGRKAQIETGEMNGFNFTPTK